MQISLFHWQRTSKILLLLFSLTASILTDTFVLLCHSIYVALTENTWPIPFVSIDPLSSFPFNHDTVDPSQTLTYVSQLWNVYVYACIISIVLKVLSLKENVKAKSIANKTNKCSQV